MQNLINRIFLFSIILLILNSCGLNEQIIDKKKPSQFLKSFDKNNYDYDSIFKKLNYQKNSLKKNYTIVIDPGHGGKDPGAIGYSGTFEKDINLRVSKIIKKMILSKNIKVILTRENDKYLYLKQRVSFAEAKNADIFISIHSDASINKKAKGASIFTLSTKSSDLEAEKLAMRENKSDLIGGFKIKNKDPLIKNNLVKIFQRETMNESIKLANLMAKNFGKFSVDHRGHRFAGFVVLKSVTIPSILIELGFISNRNEEKLLNNNYYLNKISTIICISIIEYLKKYK